MAAASMRSALKMKEQLLTPLVGVVLGYALSHSCRSYRGFVKMEEKVEECYNFEAPEPFKNIFPMTQNRPPFSHGTLTCQVKSQIPPLPNKSLMSKCQPVIISGDKELSLFLVIRLQAEANTDAVARFASKLQEVVAKTQEEAPKCCGNSKITAGVGFGPQLFQILKGDAKVEEDFTGEAPHKMLSTEGVGGDLIIHAKANKMPQLELLREKVMEAMPKDSVEHSEATFSQPGEIDKERLQDKDQVLYYKSGPRKLQLYPACHPIPEDRSDVLSYVESDGKEESRSKRAQVALNPKTGGSYLLTQKWVHRVGLNRGHGPLLMNQWADSAWHDAATLLSKNRLDTKERRNMVVPGKPSAIGKWMEKAFEDCVATRKKHPELKHAEKLFRCSHGVPDPPIRLLRQSLPFRDQSGHGVFFISYTRCPTNNRLLLQRLVDSVYSGDRINKSCRQFVSISDNIYSAFWYFPGKKELQDLVDDI